MWRNDDIQMFFSLLGAPPPALRAVAAEGLSAANMGELTERRLRALGIPLRCSGVLREWRLCESTPPSLALREMETRVATYVEISSYKAETKKSFEHNYNDEALGNIKIGKLMQVLEDQEYRINEMKKREDSLLSELERRAQLIKELDTRVLELESIADEKITSAEDIRKFLVENQSKFCDKVADTKANIDTIDSHVNSILRVAKHTVDIIVEEHKNQGHNIDDNLLDLGSSRTIRISEISMKDLKKESDVRQNESLDPFVVIKSRNQSVQTKKFFNSGVNPVWDNLELSLQVMDDTDKENNKITVEVYDEFSMISNELLCCGEISFTHLDLLNDRGETVTSVDLFDARGDFVTTARITLEVQCIGSGKQNGSFASMNASLFQVNDRVICNYGGEGEWLHGKITRYKRIRNGNDTNRIYEVEYDNGDVELNVPSNRISAAAKSRADSEPSGSACRRREMTDIAETSNAKLLESIAEMEKSSCVAVASASELDEWQKKLTKLLSEALRRYLEIKGSAKKYSVYINNLTMKISSVEDFLQRLQQSEEKCDNINSRYEASRNEIEDLRKQLATMTRDRDNEKEAHRQCSLALENERKVTLECKKEIVDLRAELDHIIEVVRRDMSNRITSKNVNEELYSLSSNLVKNEGGINGHNSTAPLPPADLPSLANGEHDDIFMQQHDWKLYISLIKQDMTVKEVEEAQTVLRSLNHSFEILSSRLLLECRHRADCEWRLTGCKENIREIKDQIVSEATLRLQLEEELQYFRELAEKNKQEADKHRKFAVIAKKAAYDAIKQAKRFQRKLNNEIDSFSEPGLGDSRSMNQDTRDVGGPSRGSPNNHNKKKNRSSKVINFEDLDDMFGEDGDGNEDRHTSGGKSPYLPNRHKRSQPSNGLHTRSENEKDLLRSQASLSSNKSKRIKVPGKKQMSYIGKKISRVFDGKSSGVAPCDDTFRSANSPKRPWVNPGYVDYAKKYGSPGASRRSFAPQHTT